MRSIDLRIPLLVGVAIVLLAFAPAKAATLDDQIQFVPGTGDSAVVDAVADAAASLPLVNEQAEKDDAQAELMAMSDKLADPRMQDQLANMVGNMSVKIMDFPIGKFVAAMEKSIPSGLKVKRGKRIRASDTVADLAGRDADRLPEDLAKGSRQMMGMMSGLAAAFATMIPDFEKLGKEMEKSFEDVREANRKRD